MANALDPDFAARFIRENTALGRPPLVPELELHLASAAVPLWELTEAELERQGLPPPYWAFAWPGGQAVARYVIDHAEIVAGRRVLDVAAGSGIVGLAAAWASAAHVVATDIDALACAAMRLNAEANGLADRIEAVDRDMLDEPAIADDGSPLFDVVLAGDVFYERGMAERMFAWLRRHAAAGALVLAGDPGRNYKPKEGLRELALYDVPVSLDLEDREIKPTRVWQVLPPGER